MFAYRVSNMTCGHCANVITKAVQSLDGQAQVDVDLDADLVSVDSIAATSADIAKAIQDAGYEVAAVNLPRRHKAESRAKGCCCGSGAAHCGA